MIFIRNARLWWRRWSTWVAAVFAGIVASVVASPQWILGLLIHVPDRWRGFAAGAAFIMVFVVPVLVRHIKQEKLDGKRVG